MGQSSPKMYSNNILKFQDSTTILNTCIKNVWKLIEGPIHKLKIPLFWKFQSNHLAYFFLLVNPIFPKLVHIA